MLRSINIENIAVIEKCNIDFCDGFNVLTGETGAGKSIVIDAINAVTGQRTSKELIRTGCDKASVSAVFENIDKRVTDKLTEYGISAEDDTIMLLRIINSDGRNLCKINGNSVNVSALRDIGCLLVNIHGQHDNQALLNPDNHCDFIDSFGKYDDLLSAYREVYDQLKDVRRDLKKLQTNETEKNQKTELLKYQINEIEAANIVENELDGLLAKRELMRNAEKIRTSLNMCLSLLAGDDENVGADSLCNQALNEFSSVFKTLNLSDSLLSRFDTAVSEISDIITEIRTAYNDISFEPHELELCEQRIDLIKSLNKKYGGSEAEVLRYCENAKAELLNIESAEKNILELEQLSEKYENELISCAEKLTLARKNVAEDFSSQICEVLRYLEMPNVIFTVDFDNKIYTKDGCDKVEFMISANLGQDARPLAKIASGGELSRIMLAIKSVMNKVNDVDTLIFDEIDTGISGRAADKVGRQLKTLSKNNQILCVTHLAQIASAAGNHLLISKATNSGNTFTDVKSITDDERVNEIARIMSGTDLTENLYKSAKELIDNHKQ